MTERIRIAAQYCSETALSGRDALAILQPEQPGARNPCFTRECMHLINENLAVGNAQDAERPVRFMTAILNVAAESQIAPPPGLAYAWIPFKEFTEADPTLLDEAVEWLERHEKDHRLMVCCRAGMGRSVSVVIAYLCLIKGVSYPDAVKQVAARRPGATPLPNLEGTIRLVRELRAKRNGGYAGTP
jgi:protein-tyrosine phosphatase